MEITLPPELAESITKITRERRVDAALLTMIKEYLELKTNDIKRRIKDYEKSTKQILKTLRKPASQEK